MSEENSGRLSGYIKHTPPNAMKIAATGKCSSDHQFPVEVLVELVNAAKRQVTFEYHGRCPICRTTPANLSFSEADSNRIRQLYSS